MPDDAVQVLGAERLAATLARAGSDLGNLTHATERTGRLVQTRAQGNAPKRTGQLARSVQADSTGEVVQVGSSLVYAPVIHNGWAGHGISPHPFLLPVAAATEPVWREFYAAEVRDVFGRVKGA